MGKEEFHQVLRKSEVGCDGVELHLKLLWRHNNSKALFMITGLDFGHILTEPTTSPLDYLFKSVKRPSRSISVEFTNRTS